MATNSFENTLVESRARLLELLPEAEAYLVSNIRTQLALYIVDASVEIVTNLKTELSDLITDIATIANGDFIHQDLQSGKVPLGENSNIFFVNRHIDKTNWYLAPHDPLPRSAHVVAFYSFKGGLGRTTALVLSALHLTRQGKKVVLVDFDLEAPGLGPLFQPDFPDIANVLGTADFMLNWQAGGKQLVPAEFDLDNYYYSITQQELVGSQGGELLIFPASRSESTEGPKMNYIDKLSKIDIQYNELNANNYAPDALLRLIDERLDADYIFIDTRTGINDIGGLVLQRYAHSAFLFFQGNTQNMFGLEALIPKLVSFELPFYLVNSPTPREPAMLAEEVNYFISASYKIFVDNYYQADKIPDLEDDTADHYPLNIPYNDLASFLDNTLKIQSLLEEKGANNPYLQLANYILADNTPSPSLPENSSEKANNSNSLVEAMSKITVDTAASESELNTEEDLRINFYPRVDYRFIFERSKFLILGEKGSGKTALYAVLSQAKYARELARFCGVNNHEWRSTSWVKGLGREGERYPSRANFNALQGLNENQLRNYWLILLCRELSSIDVIASANIELSTEILEAGFLNLKKLAQDYELSERLEDYLTKVNKLLTIEGHYITIIYDYLDSLLTDENNLRGDLVGALLGLWHEYQNRFSNLRTKIFLRKDIYEREIRDLTDKVKLNNSRQELQWNLSQLLNMVWKRILERDKDNGKAFVEPVLDGGQILEKNLIGMIPQFNQEQHTKLLEMLLGNRMGGNNKAIPYKWIEQHIADTYRHIQPRSILNLFALGAQKQLNDTVATSTTIRPQNFVDVVTPVSEARVRDLWEEYPILQPIFDSLREYLPQFPVQDADLLRALSDIKSRYHSKLSGHDPKDLLQELIKVGVLYEYKFNKTASGGIRYHIPDLYLFGLGLTRKGPGAYKNIFDSQRRVNRRN